MLRAPLYLPQYANEQQNGEGSEDQEGVLVQAPLKQREEQPHDEVASPVGSASDRNGEPPRAARERLYKT